MAKGDLHIERDHDRGEIRVSEEYVSGSGGMITLPDGTTAKCGDYTFRREIARLAIVPPVDCNPVPDGATLPRH